MPTDVIFAIGTAPYADTYDMDVLMRFIKTQKPQPFLVILFDPRWKEVKHILFDEEDEAYARTTFIYEDTDLSFEHADESIVAQRKRQTEVRAMKTLEAFGNTCPIQEGSALTLYSLDDPEYEGGKLYIYNCAWISRNVEKSEPELKQNSYFENMCELANLFASHPNAFILTNARYDYTVFSQSDIVSRDLYLTPKPGKFKQPIGGRRKRTRRGLQKRRASRRWKRQS
jgi:hypothetical protein